MSAGITKSLKIAKEVIGEIDKGTVQLGRDFGLTYETAAKISTEMAHQVDHSKNQYLLASDLQESFTKMNQQMGTFGDISMENVELFNNLTKFAGYSEEAMGRMYTTSLLTGESFEDTVKTQKGRVKLAAKASGLALDEKMIMEDISNVSSDVMLAMGGSADELIKASINAAKLGLNLGQVQKISESLLDFESSIQSELEAELLTGQQLNLETARLAAMKG